MNQGQGVQDYPTASLYVGDLHPDVMDYELHDKFSSVGPVLSVHICINRMTGESLGYAYVNFERTADAEKAIDTLNFESIKGRPIRIMWSQRDPSLRKSGVGNVFIKNLNETIDSKVLYDIFSAFGNILSCKVAQDEYGKSKGYGFVHYDSEESAAKSINEVNGMILNEKMVFVGKFIPRKERVKEFGEKPKLFTNVYVKNFGQDFTDDMLKELFETYGRITSHTVVVNEDQKARGFGFVAFEDPESAIKAIDELNGKKIAEGKILYVGLAQKKSERQQELKAHFEMVMRERKNRYQGVNLYIKNLDDTIDDEGLRRAFGPYGTITSAKVMLEEGKSKGFGFVAFADPESAEKAIDELNGKKITQGKILYVGRAQKKSERQQELKAHFEMFMRERKNRYQGVNLYIKNLDDTIDDERLRRAFGPYGTITSAKVMLEEGRSKGFGFVCYSSPEEATQAITSMNGYMVGTKPLYVALAQRKEDRKAHLHSQYLHRLANMMQQMPHNIIPARTTSDYFVPILPPQVYSYYRPTQFLNVMPQRTWTTHPNLRPIAQPTPARFCNMQGGPFRRAPTVPTARRAVDTMRTMAMTAAAIGNAVAAAAGRVGAETVGSPTLVNQGPGVATPPQGGSPVSVSALERTVHILGQESLTTAMLTAAGDHEQKQMLGERLYPLVKGIHSDLAEKITGMLLEIDTADLLHFLEDYSSLKAKVEETVAVLQANQDTTNKPATLNKE